MRKLFFLIVLAMAVLMPLTSVAAPDFGKELVGKTAENAGYAANTSQFTLAETIGAVIRAALSLVGVIFLALMVYAGYLWMTAQGEEEKVDKAQKIIKTAIIGLIIVVSAYSITYFIVPLFLSGTVQQKTCFFGFCF